VCTFCTFEAVELEKHFILECDAFKDIRESYQNMLALVSWHCLFSEGIFGRLGHLIINLNQKRKRIELQKMKNRELMVSETIFSLIDLEISFHYRSIIVYQHIYLNKCGFDGASSKVKITLSNTF